MCIRDSLNTFELKKYTYLDYPDIDFNNLKKFGIYYFPQNGINICSNSPSNEQGVLIVLSPYYTYQKFISNSIEFKRFYNFDTKIWTEWMR